MNDFYEENMRKRTAALIIENDKFRKALQQIADIEHENIPTPKSADEGVVWTVLAMAVGLAEKALK
jgi:hypothetical protein